MLRLLCLSILCLVSAACATSEPTPTEEIVSTEPFVGEINIITDPSQYGFSPALCFAINDSTIWRPGDFADELSAQIIPSISMKIDDNPLLQGDFMLTARIPSLFVVGDGQGRVLGTRGEGLIYCINASELANGDHELQVRVLSTAGDLHVNRVNFTIED